MLRSVITPLGRAPKPPSFAWHFLGRTPGDLRGLASSSCWTFGLLVFHFIPSKSGIIFGVLKCFLPRGDTALSSGRKPGCQTRLQPASGVSGVAKLGQVRSPETREKVQEGSVSPPRTAGKHCRWHIPFLPLVNC